MIFVHLKGPDRKQRYKIVMLNGAIMIGNNRVGDSITEDQARMLTFDKYSVTVRKE